MRIPSGVTDQYIYFVAVDATDFTTRETGLSSFTVYRSRNGGASAAMTTPTINETDTTNMPGVYELLLDEDMTIDAGDDEQEMVFHITHAGMAPVSRAITLYRPKITAGETLTAASGIGEANVKQVSDDSGAADNLELDYDGTGYAKANSTIGTTTTNTDMRGTDSAALATVVGALADAAADGDPTTGETLMQYVKQLINVLVGTTGIVTMPSSAAPANNVSLAGVLRAVYDDTNEAQGKLPTNNIMGSSDATDKDDEIDAIKAVTDSLDGIQVSVGYDSANDHLEVSAWLTNNGALVNSSSCTMDVYDHTGQTEKIDNAAWDTGPTESTTNAGVWYAEKTTASTPITAGHLYIVVVVIDSKTSIQAFNTTN